MKSRIIALGMSLIMGFALITPQNLLPEASLPEQSIEETTETSVEEMTEGAVEGTLETSSDLPDELSDETLTETSVEEDAEALVEAEADTSAEEMTDPSNQQLDDSSLPNAAEIEVSEDESAELENLSNPSSLEELSSTESIPSDSLAEEETLRPMALSLNASPEQPTEWSNLAKEIQLGGGNSNPEVVDIKGDIIADPDKDKETPLVIGENQHIILQGNGQIKGVGFESIKVLKGGSLTIDGPSISNCQIIVEGTLNLKNGKISDTKLEGPTVFVKSGEFIMSGGEVSNNEAILSANPQPDKLTKTGDSYNYAPITLYSGRLHISEGMISNNKGFLRGGAIGAWGTEEAKANVEISGGKITENNTEHPRFYAFGGAIYLDKANFEMTNGNISKNITEKGGAIALIESNAQILGGSISENSNGEYKGYGGALFISDSNYEINGGHFSNNSTTQSGGFLAAYGTSRGIINAGLFENNSSQGFWGGGAIYNDTNCELTINRALIKENSFKENLMIGAGNKPISRQGGGIWNCPTGNTEINITNGLAIYDNLAPNFNGGVHNGAGDDFANITKYEFGETVGNSQVKLASRMLGGGYRLWYQDGSFYSIHSNWPKEEQTPRYNPENPGDPMPYNTVINEEKGAQLVYKSVPAQESKNLAEQIATSIFRNNTAQGTGISGGAIANNGKLIFGEDNPYTIKITKAWAGDEEETRPEAIVLQMYVGEHYIEDVKLTKDENWTAIIKDFPDPDTLVDNKTGEVLPINFVEKDSGKYILSEVTREKDSEASVYTINLENSIKTTIKVNKVWEDNDDEAGLRPSRITVALLADGEETGKTIELNEDNNWEAKFENLPSHKNGESIEYTVKEVEIENGYTSTVTGSIEKGFTITNSRETEKTSLKINKIWNDNNNQDGKRPTLITVHLLKNGEKFATQEITEKDGWKWTFEDLPKYENGKEIKYTIVEEAVAGYETAIDGFNITNTYKPEKTHIQVTKVWKDNDNKDGKRPESVSVKLLANGVETDKVLVLSETNNWQGGFLDLDVYKSGKKIEYTIKEMNVGSDYEVDLTGDAAVGFKLINTHKSRKPELPKTGESNFGMCIGLFAILSASVLVVERSVKKRKED